jgi:hypothetical protein
MSQLLERPRSRRPFARMDILSQLGETICLPPADCHTPPVRRAIPAPAPVRQPTPARVIDEDPERWDGLS